MLTLCILHHGTFIVVVDDVDVVVDVVDVDVDVDRDVKPKEKVTLTLRLVGDIEPDEDGRVLTMDLSFTCEQLSAGFTGAFNLELQAPK